jgi:hypothetical protein
MDTAMDECCRTDTPACILVQRVEEPTDKKISRCFATATDASALLMAISRNRPRRDLDPRRASDSFEVPVPRLSPRSRAACRAGSNHVLHTVAGWTRRLPPVSNVSGSRPTTRGATAEYLGGSPVPAGGLQS